MLWKGFQERRIVMTAEKYKKYIGKMLEEIDDERDLSRIYAIVHIKFINSGLRSRERETAE